MADANKITERVDKWMRELAGQLFSGPQLASFNALPLQSRVSGMAILAHIGDEPEVKRGCLKALKTLKSL
jgi:hypothetical protein